LVQHRLVALGLALQHERLPVPSLAVSLRTGKLATVHTLHHFPVAFFFIFTFLLAR
jgi:hypothetical protein